MNTEKSTSNLMFMESVEKLTKDFAELGRQFKNMCSGEESLSSIADAVVGVHSLKAEMSVLYDDVCQNMINKMNNVPEVTASDGSLIEKKGGSDRKKWDHEGLAKNVASRINDMAVDLDTGEVVMTPQDMMMKMLDFAAVSYWRVKELAKIGVSADNFCEVSETKTNIIVRKAK